ncbi:unnamed protein product, partial [Rotaria socialis]
SYRIRPWNFSIIFSVGIRRSAFVYYLEMVSGIELNLGIFPSFILLEFVDLPLFTIWKWLVV